MVIQGGWMELLPDRSTTGLEQVREAPNHAFKYCFLKECAPYNVVFLPQSPNEPDRDTFAVIDRHGMLGVAE